MPGQPLQQTTFALIETAVNRALKLDPGTLCRITELNGKRFRIRCTSPQLVVMLMPGQDYLGIKADDELDADTLIEGDSRQLLRLLTKRDPSSPFESPLQITGDMQAAAQLQAALVNLEIDWEELLSRLIGDIAAHQVGNQLRALHHWGQQTLDRLIQNTEEYLHEEAWTMPPRLEVEAFYEDLAIINTATDRLSARIAKLQQNLAPANSTHQTEET